MLCSYGPTWLSDFTSISNGYYPLLNLESKLFKVMFLRVYYIKAPHNPCWLVTTLAQFPMRQWSLMSIYATAVCEHLKRNLNFFGLQSPLTDYTWVEKHFWKWFWILGFHSCLTTHRKNLSSGRKITLYEHEIPSQKPSQKTVITMLQIASKSVK